MSAAQSGWGKRGGVREWLFMQTAPAWRRLKGAWEVFAENRLALLGVGLIVLFAVMAVAHPILMATVWDETAAGVRVYHPRTGFDPTVMHPSTPSARHWLGTDALGRDVLSMLIAATTPEFVLGLTAATTAAAIGTSIGMISAYYYRGVVDTAFSYLSDAFLLMPAPLFMVIISVQFIDDIGPVQFGLLYGVLSGVSSAAIIMRSYALTVMTKPFIEACRVAGGGAIHIITRHLLPHMLPMAALYMMLTVTGAVVADGFVSFFGLERVHLNWGSMMFNSFISAMALGTGYEWHTLIPPSVALSLFAAAFYLVSRGLHEIADPRLRER
ncbi:MAG: ABC transporter permease [Anaerolineae bacterium]|nr:ABC transporter permease [Anaerolineae bacterium]